MVERQCINVGNRKKTRVLFRVSLVLGTSLRADAASFVCTRTTDLHHGRLFGPHCVLYATKNIEKGMLNRNHWRKTPNEVLCSNDRRLPFIGSAGTIVAVGVFVLPLLATAIDHHPADHASLGIPFPIPDVRYFISGGLCAAASHGVTTPIDVVKTRIQADPEFFNEGLPSATRSILEKDGFQALLGGLGPTVVGYGLEGATKFGLYESLKPILLEVFELNSPMAAYLGASVVAGAVASILLCPMERIRIRLVTDSEFARGLVTGFPRLIKEKGLLYVFSGMPAMLSKQVPYTITKQVTFDIFSGLLYSAAANYNLSVTDIKAEVSFGAALLASILSCITSQPGDVVLTATYKSQANVGFIPVVSEVYKKDGLNGFFTGLTARFLHVGSIITFQLVLYDIIKQLLGLPATGSH